MPENPELNRLEEAILGRHPRISEVVKKRLHAEDPNSSRPPEIRLATQLHLGDVFNPISRQIGESITSNEITAKSIDQELGPVPTPTKTKYCETNDAEYFMQLAKVEGKPYQQVVSEYQTLLNKFMNKFNPDVQEEDKITNEELDEMDKLGNFLDTCAEFGHAIKVSTNTYQKPPRYPSFPLDDEQDESLKPSYFRMLWNEIEASHVGITIDEMEDTNPDKQKHVNDLKIRVNTFIDRKLNDANLGEDHLKSIREKYDIAQINDLTVQQILRMQARNGAKRTHIPTIPEGEIKEYLYVPIETGMFKFVQTPIGEYGEKLATKILQTTYRMTEAATKFMEEYQKLHASNKDLIETETARGRDHKHDNTKPNPVLTSMQEGIMSLGVTVALMTIEKQADFENPDDLVRAICERQLPNILSIHIPMGWINPFSLVGKYPKYFVGQKADGTVAINSNILRETRIRQQETSTYTDVTGFGCPIGIKGPDGEITGLEALTNAFYALYSQA